MIGSQSVLKRRWNRLGVGKKSNTGFWLAEIWMAEKKFDWIKVYRIEWSGATRPMAREWFRTQFRIAKSSGVVACGSFGLGKFPGHSDREYQRWNVELNVSNGVEVCKKHGAFTFESYWVLVISKLCNWYSECLIHSFIVLTRRGLLILCSHLNFLYLKAQWWWFFPLNHSQWFA